MGGIFGGKQKISTQQRRAQAQASWQSAFEELGRYESDLAAARAGRAAGGGRAGSATAKQYSEMRASEVEAKIAEVKGGQRWKDMQDYYLSQNKELQRLNVAVRQFGTPGLNEATGTEGQGAQARAAYDKRREELLSDEQGMMDFYMKEFGTAEQQKAHAAKRQLALPDDRRMSAATNTAAIESPWLENKGAGWL